MLRPPSWPNGKSGIEHAPPDEPPCGFNGLKCQKDSSKSALYFKQFISTPCILQMKRSLKNEIKSKIKTKTKTSSLFICFAATSWIFFGSASAVLVIIGTGIGISVLIYRSVSKTPVCMCVSECMFVVCICTRACVLACLCVCVCACVCACLSVCARLSECLCRY